jgi:hypothetical protein
MTLFLPCHPIIAETLVWIRAISSTLLLLQIYKSQNSYCKKAFHIKNRAKSE